jgi:hypothetical protein
MITGHVLESSSRKFLTMANSRPVKPTAAHFLRQTDELQSMRLHVVKNAVRLLATVAAAPASAFFPPATIEDAKFLSM